ncbi:hypothetical protein C2E23DRAFT_861474 [Lenzites betulinus]|nr:hypothetical protein C2E23DRAFT_861474 [Lenzites betulinus]
MLTVDLVPTALQGQAGEEAGDSSLPLPDLGPAVEGVRSSIENKTSPRDRLPRVLQPMPSRRYRIRRHTDSDSAHIGGHARHPAPSPWLVLGCAGAVLARPGRTCPRSTRRPLSLPSEEHRISGESAIGIPCVQVAARAPQGVPSAWWQKSLRRDIEQRRWRRREGCVIGCSAIICRDHRRAGGMSKRQPFRVVPNLFWRSNENQREVLQVFSGSSESVSAASPAHAGQHAKPQNAEDDDATHFVSIHDRATPLACFPGSLHSINKGAHPWLPTCIGTNDYSARSVSEDRMLYNVPASAVPARPAASPAKFRALTFVRLRATRREDTKDGAPPALRHPPGRRKDVCTGGDTLCAPDRIGVPCFSKIGVIEVFTRGFLTGHAA